MSFSCKPWALLGLLALGAASGVMAQDAGPSFTIQSFTVGGINPLPKGEAERILQPFVREGADAKTLEQATKALEDALKAKGYGLYRVSLPPQELGGAVKLDIVRYTLNKVAVSGNQAYSEANIRRSVPEVQEGSTPNFQRMAVQTAIANESHGKHVQVVLAESTQPDQIDARIAVEEASPWALAASLSNTGSSSTGRDRVSLVGSHANLFDLDHQFSAAYTTSLAKPDQVRQLGLSYKVPLYELGGVVGASYTHSDVTGDFGAFTSNGAGRTLGLSYQHYLPPVGGQRSYLSARLEDKRFDPVQINGVVIPGLLERRSRPLALGYTVRHESDKQAWDANAELAFNLGGGAGNSLAAYQTEDPRIQTDRWKALRVSGSVLRALDSQWSLGVRATAQWSPDALIAAEQFGIGGASSVRGAPERAVSGDSGIFASVQLTSPELSPGLRWVGFADVGRVRSDTSPLSNKLGSDHLAGLGMGLHYQMGKFSLTAEWARLVSGSQESLATNPDAPQSGDSKLHVNAIYRFD